MVRSGKWEVGREKGEGRRGRWVECADPGQSVAHIAGMKWEVACSRLHGGLQTE